MTATYKVFVRDATYNEIGQLDDYETLTLNPKFNDVGAWALTLDANSPHASLLTPGTGIVVYRNGSVYFSGPLGDYHLAGNASGDTLTVGGPDDMAVIADRLALPAHGYPYSSLILASSPIRYYRMADTTDSSGGGHTATAFGGVSNGLALIDDADLAAVFDGSSGYLSVPTTGMPTGAQAWTMECWFSIPVLTSGNPYVMMAFGGTISGLNYTFLGVNTSNHIYMPGNVDSTVLVPGETHYGAATYDGTTGRLYLDGVLKQSFTEAFTLGNTFATIGRLSGSGDYANATIDEAVYYNTALSGATITSHYNTGISRFGSSASEESGFGKAGAGVWTYVDNNVGPAAGGTGSGDSARINSALSIGSVPTTVGSLISASARFDNLLQLCQTMAISGGDIGFKVLQSGTTLAFSTYTPADKTSNAMFSRGLGNLLDYDYELSRPKANYVYVLGGGQGTARAVLEESDSASITTWGARIEGSVDARDTSDYNTMSARGTAYLNQSKSQVNFSCSAIDTPTLTYGTDYNLGDKVVVYLPDGTTISDIVREVKITLDRQNGESILVGIGNPGNGAILTPANAALKTVMQSHVTVATRVSQLERRW